MIRKFLNRSTATNTSTSENILGWVKEEGEVYTRLGTTNTETLAPKVGDAVYLNAEGKPRIIALDSLSTSSVISGWTQIGSVYNIQGDEIWIVNKTGASKKWCQVRIWEVLGFTLDGASRSGVFQFSDSSTNRVSQTFTYSATSKSAFASALNTWLQGLTTEQSKNYQPYAYYDSTDDAVYFVAANYSWWQQDSYTTASSGLSLAHWTRSIQQIPANSRTPQVNNYKGLYCVVNKARIKQWGGRTPTANVGLGEINTPVSESAFNTSSYCETLRENYESYDEYLDAIAPQQPASNGAMGWRDMGKYFTELWASQTYKDKSGNTQYLCPAARYALVDTGILGNTYFGPGCWWVPDLDELVYMMKDVTYGLSGVSASDYDPVNKCLQKMSGSLIACTSSRWSCCRYAAHTCWYFCSYGYLGSGSMYYSLVVSPVCRLKIADLSA